MNPRLLRPTASGFTPRSISGLALWLDAASDTLYTTDAGPVTAVASPLDIAGCQLWLDASDASKITSSGGVVSQWTDKSATGSTWTVTSGDGGPSTGTATINGKNVLVFDGTNDSLSASAPLNTSNPLTMFVVQRISTATLAGMTYAAGTGDTFNVRQAGSTNGFLEIIAGGGRVFLGSANRTGINDIVSVTFPSATDASLYVQGLVQSPLTNAALKPTLTGTHYIGKRSDGFYLNGQIAEIIAYNTALTTADRASVEAYLAAKWSIAGVHAPATASSDPVGYWADKSGNGRHAVQATAGSRPTISATAQNSKRTLAFDGSNDALFGAGAQALKTGMTVIGAYAPGGVNFTSMFSVGENAAGKRWISGSSAAKVGLDWFTGNTSVAALASNRTGVNSFTFNPTANSVGIRIDGAQVLSQASLSPALAAYATDTFAVAGVPANNEQFLPGRIFELAVYNRVLSASECRRVEQALGTKWGITLAPTVANADAQDWINRVYQNGGSVSSATAQAVNQFCVDLENAPGGSIRDRFYRLNLFCGSFQGAFVPLFRGPSLGGTQYGGTTDSNLGSPAFLDVTDYQERGASGGLKGNGSTKYLNTGFNVDLISAANSHMSAGLVTAESASGFKSLMGANISLNTWELYARRSAGSGIAAACFGSATTESHRFGNDVVAATLAAGHIIASYPAMYRNGTAAGTTASSNGTVGSVAVSVFAQNSGGTVGSHTDARLSSYSLGLGMTASQAAAFSTAHAAFNAALGRA